MIKNISKCFQFMFWNYLLCGLKRVTYDHVTFHRPERCLQFGSRSDSALWYWRMIVCCDCCVLHWQLKPLRLLGKNNFLSWFTQLVWGVTSINMLNKIFRENPNFDKNFATHSHQAIALHCQFKLFFFIQMWL